MTKQIPLTQGQHALVDDEDYAAASACTWHLTAFGYAVTHTGGRKNPRKLWLHRFIIGDPPDGFVVDHIDGDKLNCCRNNLRMVTIAQNSYNTTSRRDSSSKFKGVSWDNNRQLWAATIKYEKKSRHLGFFPSELDAARAYNVAAAQYFGEYARLNVIPEDAIEVVRYRQARPYANNQTSQYRGVSFSANEKRWLAQIRIKGKNTNLGYFDREEEAARAYDDAAKLRSGTRAFLNFPG